MTIAPGITIAGRFELRSRAGQGGTGSVFLARDIATQRDVAVKVLSREGDDDLSRFAREAALLATIRHPNIVGYIAHGEVDGIHYIAQDWVEGMTLAMYRRSLGLSAADAVALTIGIADALGAVHAVGMIHRDVKPSNIILDGNSPEQPRLVDFGVARLTTQTGLVTRTGVVVGTPQYMSPEQARGQGFIDAASDVWSLGCVLYEALAGLSPFSGATSTAVRAKVLLGAPRPLRERCAEASPELAELVTEMLAKHPGQRPANGAVVAARLRALPPIGPGPIRKYASDRTSASKEPTTRSSPLTETNSFVLVTPQSAKAGEDQAAIAAIAARRDLETHLLEDGSAVLAAKQPGKPGALNATHAALEIRAEVWESAVTVFANAYDDDDLTVTIDRGAAMHERAELESVFGGVVDGAESAIRIDEQVAALIHDEIPVERTPNGVVVRAPRPKR
ncbi:MAG TPA: serine/threonine-protein kinase [Kofleriaceae bacterium]|nr:serine/threonine-protein kinase [Kofleriaceae bacterium]